MEIDLNKYFRATSKSRQVAELLLSGEPWSRQDIADEAKVAVTNINRVIGVLEEAGAKFDRQVGDDGHKAVFRLVAIGEPTRKHLAPPVGADARIVGAQQNGDDVLVDFETDGVRWRGKLMTPNTTVPFGKRGTVRGVEGDSLDALMARLHIDGRNVPLGYVIPVG